MHVLRKITYYMYRIGFATGQDEFDQKPVSVHTRKIKTYTCLYCNRKGLASIQSLSAHQGSCNEYKKQHKIR